MRCPIRRLNTRKSIVFVQVAIFEVQGFVAVFTSNVFPILSLSRMQINPHLVNILKMNSIRITSVNYRRFCGLYGATIFDCDSALSQRFESKL